MTISKQNLNRKKEQISKKSNGKKGLRPEKRADSHRCKQSNDDDQNASNSIYTSGDDSFDLDPITILSNPINSTSDLEKLNARLGSNPKYRAHYINVLEEIYNPNGRAKLISQILQRIITREHLMTYTNTFNKLVNKTPIHNYNHLIDTIYEFCQKYTTFSYKEDFIKEFNRCKDGLRNSHRRTENIIKKKKMLNSQGESSGVVSDDSR